MTQCALPPSGCSVLSQLTVVTVWRRPTATGTDLVALEPSVPTKVTAKVNACAVAPGLVSIRALTAHASPLTVQVRALQVAGRTLPGSNVKVPGVPKLPALSMLAARQSISSPYDPSAVQTTSTLAACAAA